jgi:UDP-N-acetyl-D-glucosamine dehydrogenase
MKKQLMARIENKSVHVVIVGLGYVGLPLAMEFARAGIRVTGYDLSERVVSDLMRGISHIQDVPSVLVQQFVEAGTFVATTQETCLAEADAVSIAVPTPLSKTRDPDMTFVVSAVDAIVRNAHAGQLIILGSTTYPGTTRELMLPRLEACGLTAGEDVFVAFSPERVDPGNATWHTRNTPKVVGGITAACGEVAAALYATCIDVTVPVSSPETAELVKLLENTFRAVNIGLVNEMAIVCDRLGVDVWEVIDAAATKPFGFMKFTPGPGIGGHCIPLDPHYLAWKMRTLNYKTRFIDLASEINSAMPEFVVEKVGQALNEHKKPLNGSRVMLIGVAYKRDIDDVRESPALDVIRLLEERGAEVVFHDPFVASISENGKTLTSTGLSAASLSACDAVVIVTDHSGIDYQAVVDHAPIVVDTRNATRRSSDPLHRVVPLAGGILRSNG